MTRAHRQRRRARLAVLACLLWLMGVEVLPALHEAMHDELAPHTHDAGGMVVTVTYGEVPHRHADGTVHAHAHAAQHRVVAHRTDGRTRVKKELPVHAGGLAHHAEALIAAAPPLHAPLPVELRLLSSAVIATATPCSIDPLAPNARGPPAIA